MKNRIRIALMVVLSITFLLSLGYLLYDGWTRYSANKAYKELAEYFNEDVNTQQNIEMEEIEEGISVPEKDIDWNMLAETNEDIYAWIYIPNTRVDYPMLQHPTDDSYYLEYNMDGSKGYPGCIYTEATYTSKDFSDFNTVIYGHNMYDGTMFKDLHNFRKTEFFEENPNVFIYTKDGVYVYELFAAYVSNDNHLNLTYNMTTESGIQSYIQLLGSFTNGNFRSVDLEVSDHIITLSTCVGWSDEQRLLVQGVLREVITDTKN